MALSSATAMPEFAEEEAATDEPEPDLALLGGLPLERQAKLGGLLGDIDRRISSTKERGCLLKRISLVDAGFEISNVDIRPR